MKQLLIIVLLIAVMISCGQTGCDKPNKRVDIITTIDTSKVVILPYDSTDIWIFKACTQAELTDEDFETIEVLLKKCIDDYNIEQMKKYEEICEKYPNDKFDKLHFVIDLTRYRRQCIAVNNQKGEKEVWINFFCRGGSIGERWKTGIIIVHDGGNCFFNLKMNLTTEEYYDFMVNGEA